MHWLNRRVVCLIAAAATVLLTAVVVAPSSRADGDGSGSCNVKFNPSCRVDVGDAGSTGTKDSNDNGDSGDSTDPCADYPDAAYGDKPPKVSQGCADELHANYCRAMVWDAEDGLEAPTWEWTAAETEAINEGMTEMNCPLVATPAGLAEQAVKTIHFPSPSGHRSPSEAHLYQGYPFTWVNLWTFYWTDPDTWTPLTATASLDGVSATVTAKPVELVFDPGDGSKAAVCDGPGRPWVQSDGNGAPTDGACAYRYSKVTSEPITSTQTIVWKITWTGTRGTSGEIPSLSTSSSGQLQVLQVQVVNR